MTAPVGNARVLVIAACLAAAVLSGCDGVGRGLVDRRSSVSGTTGCDYSKVPQCDAGERMLDSDAGIPPGVTPIDLTACGGDELPADTVATLDHALLDCANVRVELDANAGTQVASDANLSRVSLRLQSATPATLTLDRGAFEHVFVHLEGPVTLRITDPVAFGDVGISGSENAYGAPRLELADVEAWRFAVGESERAFPGQLLLRRSTAHLAHLRADAIDFSSVRIDTSAMESRVMFAADTVMTTARLKLGHATFAASSMAAVHVGACDALVLISSTFNTGEIPACTGEPLRAYSAIFSKSSVDGMIDSDSSTWTNVRFGAHTPTEFLGWSSSVDGSAFCEHSQGLRFGEHANGVHCSDCMAGSLQEPLCIFEDGALEVGGNRCADLAPADLMAPMCSGETPKRPRP